MADFLSLPSLTSEVSRENPYLNSEFGVDWSSMGLNNLNSVYDSNNGVQNNYIGNTLGNNWGGSLGAIIGSGLTLWGGYKSYKSYKNLKYDDYKNELSFTQIDIDREQTLQSLYLNNAEIMQEATDMINFNSYMQAMENRDNQGFNEQAYQNSIFNVSRQAKEKSNQMYRNIETLNLNVAAAKNAEEVRQKQEYLYAKQTTFNAWRQSLNNTISTMQDYVSQIEMLPMFSKTDVKADTSLVDNFRDPSAQQYSTTQNKLQMLKMNGFEVSQDYLSKGNKVAIGQFQASLGKEFTGTQGLNRTDFRVPNISEVYFSFE